MIEANNGVQQEAVKREKRGLFSSLFASKKSVPQKNEAPVEAVDETREVQKDPLKLPKTRKVSGLKQKLQNYSEGVEHLVAIEIFPEVIRLAEVKKIKGVWNLENLTSVDISGFTSEEDIYANTGIYAEFLSALVEKHGIKTNKVAFSLPVSSAIVRTLDYPSANKVDIDNAIENNELWSYVDSAPDNLEDYSVYTEVLSTSQDHGTSRIMLVAVPYQTIGLYSEIVDKAGLEVSIVDIRCFSLMQGFKILGKSEEALSESAILSVGVAESYLQTHLNGIQIYNFFIPDHERMLLDESIKNPDFVQRMASQIRHYISNDPQGSVIKEILVVSPQNSIEAFITELAKQMSEYVVKEYSVLSLLKIPAPLQRKIQLERNGSRWTSLLGLATERLDIFSVNKGALEAKFINVVPELKSRLKKGKQLVLAKVALKGLLILCGAFVISTATIVVLQGMQLRQTLKAMEQSERDYKFQRSRLDIMEENLNKFKALEKAAVNLPNNQLELINAYQDIHQLIPEGVWLKEISFTSPSQIIISGQASDDPNIIEFVRVLQKSKNFEKVALQTIQAKQLAPIEEEGRKSLIDEAGIAVKTFSISGQIKLSAAMLKREKEKDAKAKAEAK